MVYRQIKRLANYSAYEISEDGNDVRHRNGTSVAIVPHYGASKCGCLLTSDDGAEKKLFGLGWLYRLAWNRSLPQLQAAHTSSAGKEESTPPSATEQHELFSLRTQQELRQEAKRSEKHHRNLNSMEFSDGHTVRVTVVLHNVENNMAVVRIDSNCWRKGYWMYHLGTAKYERFSDSTHRKDGRRGDANLLWPTHLAAK